MDQILSLFPPNMANQMREKIQSEKIQLQEIRIRINRPIELNDGRHAIWLYNQKVTKQDALYLLNKISEFSLYRLEEELKQGYITIAGGHRVGISGSVIVEEGMIKAIKHISSFNIRLATEEVGFSKPYLPYLYQHYKYVNTLIIGPPQSGKTTFLRDLAKYISTGVKQYPAYKTAIVDERSEICAAVEGVPQLSFGLRVDVMDACPKSQGMMMLVRSMSPEVMIVDEIGSQKDVQALQEVIHTGVQVICTIHGESLDDIQNKPALQPLLESKAFERYVILSMQNRTGEVKHILDQNGRVVSYQKVIHR
ncbi:stage III sporulation protein AA [Gracilibacillus halophilus YIM-C55.5]|uniref:Stage III sporulation protein AA n=1 Tax=Gracilibacillus halophilus YIM-C55.5 TaxID=1308866 RepID=N4WMQ5_9BACI|nr:stage III sporulation protein AA [Gracilibacillus halophilus]ENH97442.1 stage III sporulation protein AA [Gracilibacillus halophilus YIM-C55.5]